jgi:hypothetical protein
MHLKRRVPYIDLALIYKRNRQKQWWLNQGKIAGKHYQRITAEVV